MTVVLILTVGCKSADERYILNKPSNLNNTQEEVSFIGKVKWIPLEGGFYGLVAEDGKKFLPLNLPKRSRRDGLKIKVRGKIKNDVVTFYLWGVPFEIYEIDSAI